MMTMVSEFDLAEYPSGLGGTLWPRGAAPIVVGAEGGLSFMIDAPRSSRSLPSQIRLSVQRPDLPSMQPLVVAPSSLLGDLSRLWGSLAFGTLEFNELF